MNANAAACFDTAQERLAKVRSDQRWYAAGFVAAAIVWLILQFFPNRLEVLKRKAQPAPAISGQQAVATEDGKRNEPNIPNNLQTTATAAAALLGSRYWKARDVIWRLRMLISRLKGSIERGEPHDDDLHAECLALRKGEQES